MRIGKDSTMRSTKFLTLSAVLGIVCLATLAPMAVSAPAESGVGPTLQSVGPITFGPDDILFVADNQAAMIFALELGDQTAGRTPGTKDVAAIDQKIAALLGTDAREILISDLAVSPSSRNAFIAVSRGQGANAMPVLLRVDGAGEIDVISLDAVKYSNVALPNAPDANPTARRNPRMQSITDMAYAEGRLFIAGLSNEEFTSKLRSVPFPFAEADNGTSVEIWHAAHGRFETQSPVYTFVPYDINGEAHLIAGYLCTPLVKFPIADLKPGTKVMGTTIAELGNRNRPLDMIVYKQGGKDYLLMSNTSRGVMKVPTETFGSQSGLTEQVGDKAGVAYETISQMTGVEQLDLLDESRALVITRNDAGMANLEAVALP